MDAFTTEESMVTYRSLSDDNPNILLIDSLSTIAIVDVPNLVGFTNLTSLYLTGQTLLPVAYIVLHHLCVNTVTHLEVKYCFLSDIEVVPHSNPSTIQLHTLKILCTFGRKKGFQSLFFLACSKRLRHLTLDEHGQAGLRPLLKKVPASLTSLHIKWNTTPPKRLYSLLERCHSVASLTLVLKREILHKRYILPPKMQSVTCLELICDHSIETIHSFIKAISNDITDIKLHLGTWDEDVLHMLSQVLPKLKAFEVVYNRGLVFPDTFVKIGSSIRFPKLERLTIERRNDDASALGYSAAIIRDCLAVWSYNIPTLRECALAVDAYYIKKGRGPTGWCKENRPEFAVTLPF